MLIGLLVCDHARSELSHPDGSYPEMFRRILPGFEFRDYYVCDNDFPAGPDECDGWLISGSRLSVYDNVDWVNRLKSFTREIAVSGKACIGVCFGHQMIGAALGGVVRKAETGWCAGVLSFKLISREDWMEPFSDNVNLLMSCQDQVLELPPDAVTLAGAPTCPNGMIRVGKNMLGIQGHPEFSVDFEEKLIGLHAPHLAPGQAGAAMESLKIPVHSTLVAGWMKNWFHVDPK